MWGAGALALVVGCGIGIGRDLRNMPPPQVIYDDVCQVQAYFDALEAKRLQPPAVVASSEVQRSSDEPMGGISKFAFEGDQQLVLFRRVLTENWKNVPPKLMAASRIEVEVKWAVKAGARRVVTTEDALISYDGKTGYLPYHICLSEVLFGAPLYKTRRELLGDAPPEEAPLPSPVRTVPLVTSDAGTDAGATPEAVVVH